MSPYLAVPCIAWLGCIARVHVRSSQPTQPVPTDTDERWSDPERFPPMKAGVLWQMLNKLVVADPPDNGETHDNGENSEHESKCATPKIRSSHRLDAYGANENKISHRWPERE